MTVMTIERPAVAVRPISEKLDYCRALAASGLLPAQYRQQPANLLYAVEFADSLGLHPMVAITGVHVIEGKPSASSALISALVRRAGHKLRVKGDARQAVAQIVRADDPSYTFEVVFTIEDAERAGLLGKKIWKSYPASMLKARAISAVARDACEEALFGVHYTPEELGAEVDAEGNPIEAEFVQRAPREADPWQQPAPVQQTPPETVAAGVADVPPESLTPTGRDYLHEAHAAPDAATVRLIWRDARAEGAVPEYLAQIAEVGRAKAAAADAERAPSDPTESTAGSGTATAGATDRATASPRPEPTPAATLPGSPAAPSDRLAALTDLYEAGAVAGLSGDETRRVLADDSGKALPDVSVAEIAACTEALRAATGGAR